MRRFLIPLKRGESKSDATAAEIEATATKIPSEENVVSTLVSQPDPQPSTSRAPDQGWLIQETSAEPQEEIMEFSPIEEPQEDKKNSIPKGTKRYQQKYSSNWEVEFNWCQKSSNSIFPYCKVCNKEIRGNRSHLERHQKNLLHLKNLASKKNTATIETVLKKKVWKNQHLVKQGELKLAAFVAEHDLSFKVMEHLPKLIKSVCPDSDIACKIKSSRTKTTETINNAMGPYVTSQIVCSLKHKFYSVIIDETTDISTKKCLSVLVRFYCDKVNKVCDVFLGLLELENDSTATNIYKTLMTYLNDIGLTIENMAGFAADNCATMMGHLNGVQSLLRVKIPNLVVVGCTSHSFNLCSTYACSKLPKSIEDLVRDIYSHFSYSSKRQHVLKTFQAFCELKPHKILRPSETRWLSLQQVVDRVLEQYDALILYFTDSVYEDPLHKSANILEMLNNRICKMYLFFLSYILKIVNTINIEYQSEKPRLHQLLPRVSMAYKKILKNFMKPIYINTTEISKINPHNPGNYLPLNEMYFSFQVEELIQNHSIIEKDLHDFRVNCLNFYIELCTQIKRRFPFENELYQQLTWLDPVNIFSENKINSIVPLARKFPNMISNDQLENLNSEWRSLSDLPINKFNAKMELEDLVQELEMIKNSLGESLFPVFCSFLKNILCLPHGSSAAERIFSSLNLIKRSNRNSLLTSTCQNLLLTKEMLRHTSCCDWEPSAELVKKYRD